MVTGAAPEVRDGFRAAAARVALAGVALGLAVASCHRSRPPAPATNAPPAATNETTTAAVPPPRGKQIVVAYSSNILGEYEPCG